MQLYQPPGARRAAGTERARGSGDENGGGGGKRGGRGGKGGRGGRGGRGGMCTDETRPAVGGRGGRGRRGGRRGGRGSGNGGMAVSLSAVAAVEVDLPTSGMPTAGELVLLGHGSGTIIETQGLCCLSLVIAELSLSSTSADPAPMAVEEEIAAMAAAAEQDAAAAVAATAADRQRKERLGGAGLVRQQQLKGNQEKEQVDQENGQSNGLPKDGGDADASIERFETWLEKALEQQHGVVGDTATMYVSFAVALLQLEEKGESTLEELGKAKLAALHTLFGELSSENISSGDRVAEGETDDRSDRDVQLLGAQCWEFWASEVLPCMEDLPSASIHMSSIAQGSADATDKDRVGVGTARGGMLAAEASSPEPEPELAPERRVDPSDGVAYEYASFEEVYGPLRAPELWLKAGELMKQAETSGTECEGSAQTTYVPPHKKGKKKGSKKGVSLSLDELGFLFQSPSGGGGLSSSSSDLWSHDHYERGGRSWSGGEQTGSYNSDWQRGSDSRFRSRASYSTSTPRAAGSLSSMSYGGLARSSALGSGGSARNSDDRNRPSSSTEVAHRMIMHVLRSQYVLMNNRGAGHPCLRLIRPRLVHTDSPRTYVKTVHS